MRELGLGYLRWGPPYYRVHQGPDRYDWAYADDALSESQRLAIVPIVDLCHFGVPDWIGDLQNPDWPELFAAYAAAFAARYPWVRFYTPVNEIVFVAAIFSAQIGWWNERLASDRAFVTALKHLVRANSPGRRGHPAHAGTGGHVSSSGARSTTAPSSGSNGVLISRSGKGNCYDHSMVGTFFKMLKAELLWRTVSQTRVEATIAIARNFGGFA